MKLLTVVRRAGRSRLLIAVFAAVLGATVSGSIVAYAASSTPSPVYWACLKSGALSSVTVNSQPSCGRGSTLISWNAQGVQGVGVTAAPASTGCGTVGGYTLTSTDPSTGSSTVVGNVCNGAPGTSGTGPTSLDDLNGLPCNHSSGQTGVVYNGTAVSLTCAPPPVTLTVTTTGTGSGTITSNPAGINCGGGNSACSMPVPPGTAVTLSATAGTGSAWTAVSPSCSPSAQANTCSLTVTVNTTAAFTFQTGVILSVGSQYGGLTTGDGTINCATQAGPGTSGALGCQNAYTGGTPETLTFHQTAPNPPAGTFNYVWNGPGCSGLASNPCSTIVNNSAAITVVQG